MVYVARRKCGCVVAAILDDTEDLMDDDAIENRRKAISDVMRIWIRVGWSVDRVAPADVPAQWFDNCPHVPRQKRLDDGASVTMTNMATGERVTLP
jgi:hypothetical protein